MRLRDEGEALFAQFQGEVGGRGVYRHLRDFVSGGAILNAAPAVQCQVALVAAEHFTTPPLRYDFPVMHAINDLLRKALPWSASDLAVLASRFATRTYDAWIRLGALIDAVDRLRAGGAVPAELVPPLRAIGDGITRLQTRTQEQQRVAARIAGLLGDPAPLPLDPGETWSALVLAQVASSTAPDADAWRKLLQHAADANGAKPNAKWLKAADALLRPLRGTFCAHGPEWFAAVDALPDRSRAMPARNALALRGLVWAVTLAPEPDLLRALVPLATACFRDERAPRAGNACVWALGQVGSTAAVGHLAVLKTRAKNRSVQREIEKALLQAAQRLGMTRDELEELAVPDCGLERVGEAEFAFGEIRLRLGVRADDSRVELAWRNAQGKVLKSAPQAVKTGFAEAWKAVKSQQKDLERQLTAQRDRLDGLYLTPRSWPVAQFRERYLDHPVVGTLARRLLWTFTCAGSSTVALPHDGAFQTVDGRAFAPDGAAVVSLWHPLDGDAGCVRAWRERLQALHVVQPFKQAHRELYVLTEAERKTHVYSNRFAAHVLKQHQFAALAAARGWRHKLRLLVDDDAPPAHRELPAFGLRAEFWIEGVGDTFGVHTTAAGSLLHLSTDQVRFYDQRAGLASAHMYGGGYRVAAGAEPLPLERIPERVLSEVLRDVDLFVGVASVGNDPTWADQGRDQAQRDYWRGYAFGELSATAQTRKQVLETLLPKLAIGPRCTFSERFLVVRGDLRTYRIHLGSGKS